MSTLAFSYLAAVRLDLHSFPTRRSSDLVAPFVQVVPAAMAKSPGFKPARTMLVMLRVAVPLLVRVTVCTGLVVQIGRAHDGTPVAPIARIATIPVHESDTDRVLR